LLGFFESELQDHLVRIIVESSAVVLYYFVRCAEDRELLFHDAGAVVKDVEDDMLLDDLPPFDIS
jgi:hypothetical protein